MNFTIPQFIDMQSKVVGPLTFKQFVFIAIGTSISFIVYFALGKASMPLALAVIAVIEGTACAFAFVKMDGIDLATVLKHYIMFASSPHVFLWKNLATPSQLMISQEKITIQKAPTNIKINLTTQKSGLKQMRDYMETS